MHIKLFFGCWEVVGAFETRKWPMKFLVTSEVSVRFKLANHVVLTNRKSCPIPFKIK